MSTVSFTCYRAAVRLTYLPSRQTMTWYPIIEATSEEHARRKATEVYGMTRVRALVEVIGLVPLHDSRRYHGLGIDTGDILEVEKATTPDAAPTKTPIHRDERKAVGERSF